MQNYWNLDLNVNGNHLSGPLIIGTFKKRAPGPLYVVSSTIIQMASSGFTSRKFASRSSFAIKFAILLTPDCKVLMSQMSQMSHE